MAVQVIYHVPPAGLLSCFKLSGFPCSVHALQLTWQREIRYSSISIIQRFTSLLAGSETYATQNTSAA